MKSKKPVLMKEVSHMAKIVCYEEVCGINDKIHLRNWILAALAVAVLIETAIIVQTSFTVFELLNLAIFPTDF